MKTKELKKNPLTMMKTRMILAKTLTCPCFLKNPTHTHLLTNQVHTHHTQCTHPIKTQTFITLTSPHTCNLHPHGPPTSNPLGTQITLPMDLLLLDTHLTSHLLNKAKLSSTKVHLATQPLLTLHLPQTLPISSHHHNLGRLRLLLILSIQPLHLLKLQDKHHLNIFTSLNILHTLLIHTTISLHNSRINFRIGRIPTTPPLHLVLTTTLEIQTLYQIICRS